MISAGMSVIYSPHFMRQGNKAQDMKRKYVFGLIICYDTCTVLFILKDF
jgi:hypothetical protein